MKNLILLFLVASAVACQTVKEPTLKDRIAEMEAEMADDVTQDSAMAHKLTRAYEKYVSENPEDSLSPYYLSKAADIYKEVPRRGLKSVNTYNQLFVEYPEHPLAPRAVFMIGFVFDEKYNDRERATKSYTFFLEQYPNHELADDARNLLALLNDTTASQLDQVKMWRQKADSTQLKSQE
mgnify:CR=1 FL=1